MRRLLAILLVGSSITAACVIGPKHDDPESDLAAKDAGTDDDSAFAADTTPGSAVDTGTSEAVDASSGSDAAKTEDGSTDAPADGADAPSDGSVDAVSDALDAAEGG